MKRAKFTDEELSIISWVECGDLVKVHLAMEQYGEKGDSYLEEYCMVSAASQRNLSLVQYFINKKGNLI